jgi:L,D-transpeptidase YcbB
MVTLEGMTNIAASLHAVRVQNALDVPIPFCSDHGRSSCSVRAHEGSPRTRGLRPCTCRELASRHRTSEGTAGDRRTLAPQYRQIYFLVNRGERLIDKLRGGVNNLGAILCAIGLGIHSVSAVAQVPESTDPVIEAVRERVEALSAVGRLSIEGASLTATRSLPTLYELHGFQPFWDSARVAKLLDIVRASATDGLTPADYHFATLERLVSRMNRTSQEAAELDLLATDAYTELVYHLYFGKVDPVSIDGHWNFEQREMKTSDAVQFVFDAMTSTDMAIAIDAVRPTHWMYRSLVDALATYRHIEAVGGWPMVADGPTLRRGITDPRVAQIRLRLSASGDDPGVPTADVLFDEHVEAALKRFQARHFLTQDGVIGPATRRELNVSVAQRIDQIRINLERARWVLHQSTDGDFVIVDVAGFEVRYVRDRTVIWRTRAQVGQPYRQTPIFRSAIQEVVFNPTWTVPPGILGKDVLPAIRRDPAYLQKRGLRVIDRNGRPVNEADIDFSRYTGATFPFMVRQDPGPSNALGRVKIMFPNPYLVYLHDTPSQAMFEHEQRAFSSGCIRTERPFELVELLLASPDRWSRAIIDATVASGTTRTIRLPKPVPVLILYWTVDRDAQGAIVFKPDPYSRDPKLLKALDRPFARTTQPSR